MLPISKGLELFSEFDLGKVEIGDRDTVRMLEMFNDPERQGTTKHRLDRC